MKSVNIHLMFQEYSCEEAFAFYREIFKTEFSVLLRYQLQNMGNIAGIPHPDGNGNMHVKDDDKIMYISMPLTEHFSLSGTDTAAIWMPNITQGNNVIIDLNFETKAEADYHFDALGAGGHVIIPQSTTNLSYFGILMDRFGVSWMISVKEF